MRHGLRLIAGSLFAAASALPALADGHTDEFFGAKGYVGDKGYIGEVATPEPVRQDHVVYSTHRTRVRHVQQFTVPGCPERFTGIYRGTLYCVNGRPMP